MPRPKGDRRRTNLMIDNDLLDFFNLLLIDPRTGKKKHGALSKVVNVLLRGLERKLREEETDPREVMSAFGINMNDLIGGPDDE